MTVPGRRTPSYGCNCGPTTDRPTTPPGSGPDQKYAGQRATVKPTPGTIPGFNDVLNKFPFTTNYSTTVDYAMNSSTVVVMSSDALISSWIAWTRRV